MSTPKPAFKYRLQSADGRVHVAVGRAQCVRVCADLSRQFGPKGYSLLLPVSVDESSRIEAARPAAGGAR